MNKETFLEYLPVGKDDALTAEEIYYLLPISKRPEKEKMNNFRRIIRLFASQLRQDGYRVVGDNNGYYLCQDDENWEYYVNRQLASIRSNLKSLAKVEHKKVNDFIYRLYAKKEPNPMQLEMNV